MRKLRNISRYLIQGLIPFIFLLFLNASINKHYHILPSGEVVMHSHMHDSGEDSGSSHSHTDKELKLLNLTGNPNILILIFFLGIMIFLASKKSAFSLIEGDLESRYLLSILHNKAPPSFVN